MSILDFWLASPSELYTSLGSDFPDQDSAAFLSPASRESLGVDMTHFRLGSDALVEASPLLAMGTVGELGAAEWLGVGSSLWGSLGTAGEWLLNSAKVAMGAHGGVALGVLWPSTTAPRWMDESPGMDVPAYSGPGGEQNALGHDGGSANPGLITNDGRYNGPKRELTWTVPVHESKPSDGRLTTPAALDEAFTTGGTFLPPSDEWLNPAKWSTGLPGHTLSAGVMASLGGPDEPVENRYASDPATRDWLKTLPKDEANFVQADFSGDRSAAANWGIGNARAQLLQQTANRLRIQFIIQQRSSAEPVQWRSARLNFLDPTGELAGSELRQQLEDVLPRLSDRGRLVVNRLVDGIPPVQIAQELKTSRTDINNIADVAFEQIKRALVKQEPTAWKSSRLEFLGSADSGEKLRRFDFLLTDEEKFAVDGVWIRGKTPKQLAAESPTQGLTGFDINHAIDRAVAKIQPLAELSDQDLETTRLVRSMSKGALLDFVVEGGTLEKQRERITLIQEKVNDAKFWKSKELSVVHGVMSGMSGVQIGDLAGISDSSVFIHAKNIAERLHLVEQGLPVPSMEPPKVSVLNMNSKLAQILRETDGAALDSVATQLTASQRELIKLIHEKNSTGEIAALTGRSGAAVRNGFVDLANRLSKLLQIAPGE